MKQKIKLVKKNSKNIGDPGIYRHRQWSENDKNNNLFSPLNASIPVGMIPFAESLKNTYDRVIPFYENEIKKNLTDNKNVLISAHGNSLRALQIFI